MRNHDELYQDTTQLDAARTARAQRLQGEMAALAPSPESVQSVGQQVQGFLDTALPIAGSTVGGIAGGTMGARRGAPRQGAAAGAGLGGAAGQLGAEVTRPFLDPTVAATPREQITEGAINVLGAGVAGAAGEGALGLLTTASQPARNAVARVIQHRLAPEVLERGTMEAQEVLTAGGSTLSAAQLTGPQSRLINILEGIGRSGFVTSGGSFAARQDAAIDNVAGQLVTALGPGTALDDVAASKLFGLAVKDEFGKLLTLAGGRYQQVDAMAKAAGVTVDTTPVMNLIAMGAKNRNMKKVVLSALEGNPAKALATQPTGAGRFASLFEEARSAEIALHNYARTAKASKNPDIQARGRLAANLAKSISDAVDNSASRLGPQARQLFDEANALWSTNIDRFRGPLITKVVNALEKEPGRLSRLLLTSGSADTVRAVKDAIGTKRFNEVVKPKLVLSMLYRAADSEAISSPVEAATMLTGGSLLKQMKTLGPDLLQEILDTGAGGASVDDMTKLAFALERVAMKESGPGGFAIALRQPGAVAQVGGAIVGGSGLAMDDPSTALAGAAVVISPAAFMRIVSSKRLVNALAHGIDMGPAGAALIRRTVTRATTQAVAQAKRAEVLRRDEAKQTLSMANPSAKDVRRQGTASMFAAQGPSQPTISGAQGSMAGARRAPTMTGPR